MYVTPDMSDQKNFENHNSLLKLSTRTSENWIALMKRGVRGKALKTKRCPGQQTGLPQEISLLLSEVRAGITVKVF